MNFWRWRAKHQLFGFLIVLVVSFGFGALSVKNDRPKPSPATSLIAVNKSSTPVLEPIVSGQITPSPSVTNIAVQEKHDLTPPNCGVEACLALTFDDGPDPINTPRILAALNFERVYGTFFVIGNKIANNQELMKHIDKSGHEIGNHSWDHHDFRKMTPEQIRAEIDQTQQAVQALGIKPPTTFRPPYEFTSPQIEAQIHLPIILWNIDPKDWMENNPAVLEKAVTEQARPGAIIVMHATKPATAEAIGKIIEDLKPHYRLVTVSQLLDLKPDSQGRFFSR